MNTPEANTQAPIPRHQEPSTEVSTPGNRSPELAAVEELTRLLGQMEAELVSVYNLLVWPQVAALPRPFTSGCVADTVHAYDLHTKRELDRLATERDRLRAALAEHLAAGCECTHCRTARTALGGEPKATTTP